MDGWLGSCVGSGVYRSRGGPIGVYPPDRGPTLAKRYGRAASRGGAPSGPSKLTPIAMGGAATSPPRGAPEAGRARSPRGRCGSADYQRFSVLPVTVELLAQKRPEALS